MPDDLTKRRPQDSSRVNINEPWEVKFWCKEFGITEARLKQLVKQYGTSAAVIRSKI